ncbi:helix-turn-helix transcriptional regulator [Flammeovirga sp. OC4]|uniref:helix-turn-helix domain-containing protein n=1 Tax=Flammeovirga sp. OC4 TaxID=1382345 RepID=UPI000693F24D|nr:helix-turn-helix transcriptional regulator [Flammeovirga sp. OC4]
MQTKLSTLLWNRSNNLNFNRLVEISVKCVFDIIGNYEEHDLKINTNELEFIDFIQSNKEHYSYISELELAKTGKKTFLFHLLKKEDFILSKCLLIDNSFSIFINKTVQDQYFIEENFSKFNTLSKRESSILEFICEGKTNNEISVVLSISKYTVENHRKSIIKKLDTNYLYPFHIFFHLEKENTIIYK